MGNERARRRLGPWASGQTHVFAVDASRDSGSGHLADAPRVITLNPRRCHRVTHFGDRSAPKCITLLQVERGERNIVPVLGQPRDGSESGCVGRFGLGDLFSEFSQDRESTLGEHAHCCLLHGAEDAPHVPGLVNDRAIGKREVGFFGEALSIDAEKLVLRPGRMAAPSALQHRQDNLPDLRPRFLAARAEHGRVLAAHHRQVGVVVDKREVLPPEDDHGKAGGENDADGCAKTLRPRRGMPHPRAAPVALGSNEFTDGSAAPVVVVVLGSSLGGGRDRLLHVNPDSLPVSRPAVAPRI